MAMENKESADSLLGNRYQLQRSLGVGGMAMVYLARDLMLERPVAIKILKQDFSQNSQFRTRFRQEAQSAANLSHPNIVTVHDFGFHKGRLYIVMEFVPGLNLKTLMKQTGKFSIAESLDLIIQACSGIGYAHRAGLVHCDVKPHNMLVSPDQRLKVTDFGISRALSSIHPDEVNDVVWGSPQYFSPEQAAGNAPSPASDVYSIGVILYEMLSGKLPFNSENPVELARMHREDAVIPPSTYNAEIPQSLEQIIIKVLSKEPSSRYRTADQLGRILSTYRDHFLNSTPVVQAQAQVVPTPPATPSAIPATRPMRSTEEGVIFSPGAPMQTSTSFQSSVESANKQDSQIGVDWLTIALGLLAAISVGGLIPFWLYIWLINNTQRMP